MTSLHEPSEQPESVIGEETHAGGIPEELRAAFQTTRAALDELTATLIGPDDDLWIG